MTGPPARRTRSSRADARTWVARPEEEWELVRRGLAGLPNARRSAAALASVPTGRGYRVLAAEAGSVATITLGERPCDFVVLGRHSDCDLVLGAERSVSLRHAIVLPFVEGARRGVEVLTLDTSLPLVLGDGELALALRIEGEGQFVIGPYAIDLMPLDESVCSAALELAPGVVPRRVGSSDRTELRGTTRPLGTFTDLGDLLRERGSVPPTDAEATLRVEHGGRVACAGLSATELERGILLGRYTDRCFDPRLHAVLGNERVSRVHLLIRRAGDALAAYDTASTNGVRLAGEPVRYAAIDRGRLALEIGARKDPVAVTIDWRRGA